MRDPGRARVRCWGLAAALVCAASAFLPPAACAKDANPPAAKAEQKLPEPLTREAIRELTSRLTDAEVRQLLIQQLDRAAVPSKAGPGDMSGMVLSMEQETERARGRVGELRQALAQLPETLQAAHDRFLEGRQPGHLLRVVLRCALVLVLAYLVDRFLYRRAVRSHRARLEEQHSEGFAAQTARNLLRFLLDLGGLAVFGAAALGVFYALYQGHEHTRLVVLAIIGAALLFRLVALASRFLLEPDAPALRLLPFGDDGARRLHRGVLWLAVLYLVGIYPLFLLLRLGAPVVTAEAVSLLVGALLLLSAIATVWAIRHDIGAMIRGPGEVRPLARLLAEIWPALTSAFLLVVYGALVLDALAGRPPAGKGILSLLLLVALPMADLMLGRALHAAMLARTGNVDKAGAAGPSYEPVIRKALHVVVAVTGVVLLADVWEINFVSIAERGLGQRIAGELLGIGVIVLLAHLLWQFARTALERMSLRDGGLPGGKVGDEGGDAVASRLGTLLPIIRMTVHGTIIVVTVLGVLAALGINILPLLAGASIVGMAIAFGAQTLVRDIVSGAFFLADDAFRVGEYIEVGESKGTVEKISIRSLMLRHHRGALNVLPYGEIRRLRNTSRDWMIMKLEFRLTYDTDLLKVKKILKKIGEEISANPEFAKDLLQPLKSQGVSATEDSALLVRAKFMCRPTSTAYMIRREAYTRILKEFADAGIKFAHKEVTVHVPPGAAPDAAAVAAAAGRAVSEG